MPRLLDASTGETVLPRLAVAPAFGLAAARGLLGRAELDPGEGLLLADPLRCIHTWGMRFPIDVVFLDRGLAVVAVAVAVQPRRLAWHRRGHHQLEVAAGSAAALALAPGRRLLVAGNGGRGRGGSPHVGSGSGDPAHERRAAPCDRREHLPSIPPSDHRSTSQGASSCARIC